MDNSLKAKSEEFKSMLQKMKVDVNKIFERKWTEMINQGAIKGELVTQLRMLLLSFTKISVI